MFGLLILFYCLKFMVKYFFLAVEIKSKLFTKYSIINHAKILRGSTFTNCNYLLSLKVSRIESKNFEKRLSS